MSKRMVSGTFIALMMSLALVAAVSGASTYSVSVLLDETTRGDLDVVAASLENTPPGSEVQRSLRRLATSAAGELALLAGQRIDSNGVLTLDNGSTAALAPEDEIIVSGVGEQEVEYVNASGVRVRAARKRVVIIPQPCSSGTCPMKPLAILISTNSGCRRVLLFAHPPLVGSC